MEWEREWWRRWEGGERTGGDGKGGEFRRGRDEKERGGGRDGKQDLEMEK